MNVLEFLKDTNPLSLIEVLSFAIFAFVPPYIAVYIANRDSKLEKLPKTFYDFVYNLQEYESDDIYLSRVFAEFYNNNRSELNNIVLNERFIEHFQKVLHKNILEGNWISIILDCDKLPHFELKGPIQNSDGATAKGLSKAGAHVRNVRIGKLKLNCKVKTVKLEDVEIDEVIVEQKFRGRSIHISDCLIKRLRFNTIDHPVKPSIFLDGCMINAILFFRNCCHNLSIKKCLVNFIRCDQDNSNEMPISGDVRIVGKSPLLCDDGEKKIDLQSYRNLSANFRRLNNLDAEKYVEGFEKRSDRRNQGIFLRIISFLYDASSFYGNYPGRAIIYLLAITLYSTVILYCMDGAAVTKDCGELRDWQVGFCDGSWFGRVKLTLTASAGAMFSPFSIFKTNMVVGPKYFWVGLWLAAQSVISLALLAVIVIGIRRKFVSR